MSLGAMAVEAPPAITGRAQSGVHAFRIDTTSALSSLRATGRPAFAQPGSYLADISGTHLLVAHTEPSAVTVWRISADGTLGAELKQPATLDAGFWHQVRVDPSNHMVILVTRQRPTRNGQEDRAR